jgi:Acyl-CoA reductase (LuxC)
MDEKYRGIEETMEKYSFELSLSERINILSRLGEYIAQYDDKLSACILLTSLENKWFTEDNIRKALNAIHKDFLDFSKLQHWVQHYDIQEFAKEKKTIGIVMAGNIPLVGFHDALCVFATGNKALIKLSDKDKRLLPYLVEVMKSMDSRVSDYFEFNEMLKNMDAVIATGSNNSARYFEAYFSKYPHIIRKNRNAIAILDGKETNEELLALGSDIFEYFGLGCRNVSKIYFPKDYELNTLLEILHENFKDLVLHDKYKNNYDYNYALYALNRTPFLATGSLLVTENNSLQSRIAMLHYEYYENMEMLENELLIQLDDIQCISTNISFKKLKTFSFGEAQHPSLMDYPDGVDVMEWLSKQTSEIV